MEPCRHLLLLLALLVYSSPSLADATRVPELHPSITKAVHDICVVATHNVTCLNAPRVFAKEYNLVINKDTMMEMHMKLGISRTRAAKAAAERLMRTPTGSKGLQSCVTLYGDMLADFDTALAALKRGDQVTTMTYLSAMFGNIGACDSEFEVDKAKNPLERRNKILRRISSNALAIGRSKWNTVV